LLRPPESDAGAGASHTRARPAAVDSLRQQAGANGPAFSGLVYGEEDRVGAHSTGPPDAEGTGGKFQRADAGGMLDGDLVRESVRGAGVDRGVAEGYNQERPHSSLGYRTPEKFAREMSGEKGCGKGAARKSKNNFSTPLGNPARGAGYPLSHSPGGNFISTAVQVSGSDVVL
jgi:hypothetical protein